MKTQGEAKQAYEQWHSALSVDAEAATPWHDLVRQHLDLKRDIACRTILEMACGRGGFGVWLAKRSAKPSMVVASDFAQSAVLMGKRYAQQNDATSTKWNVGDITRIAHPDNTFDTIFCCETIEHVPSPETALSELARVLRPGGRLFLTTPNYLGIYGLYRIYLRLRGKPYTEEGQPINHPLLLPRTITWVRRAKLKIAAVDGVGHYLLVPGRVPRRLGFLDRARAITRFTGLHSLIVAVKPEQS